ncbi:DNA helicase-2 / ATP-dependent DNA helicase PcrA [Bosea sp. CRIB-10]|uniref:UvrD-helicase domain-containing protein n=1 Tax=Bosea sp. CRIB-10 TaxID=378404 RepID=UPI0008E18C67|nr:UvrD-helicase domain-containing protein [Bosea sp. CRIB-10]SFC84362.1 DNA helicase-2 / ATP-dependent DNA helicase PcrA [Bosea sp. CRIB-10]
MTQKPDNPALIAAKDAQAKVEKCLDEGRSFRLEAGAGAGKTYSLVAALKRTIATRGAELMQSGRKIACITYTEVARDEIAREVERHPAILVETIHAFSWAFLRQYQKALRELIAASEKRKDKLEEAGGVGSKLVEYELGFFGVDDKRITLAHDDIPLYMSQLLAKPKFQLLFQQQFPIVFIDEYQDTDRDFMTAITDHYFTPKKGPIIGLFGDHWQTIYNSEYELAAYPVEAIDKGSNFRSVPAIVNVLNRLRPELTQAVAAPAAAGEARFFHTNQFTGARTNTPHSRADLFPEMARTVRESLMQRLQGEGWDLGKTKMLMLTHNVLAAEQGYPSIAKVFSGRNDAFARKEDPSVRFFAETLEPMAEAYQASKYGELFRLYGARPAIDTQADKQSWRNDMDALMTLRNEGTIGGVLEHLQATKRPVLPDRVLRREEELRQLNGQPVPEEATSLQRHQALREIAYPEMAALVRFVEKQTPFATQHSVKGAEFENVLVVLGGGWNHYNWPLLLELIETKALTAANAKGFYRARNLFYVSISRPMKRLAVLATQTLSATALTTAAKLFGEANVEALAVVE